MPSDFMKAQRESLWSQFGAAIDTLENTITACPENLWSGGPEEYPYWYWVSQTLFWLDYYLSDSPEGFAPPAPFGLEELDPAGVIPPVVYSKEQLLEYLQHCRQKARTKIMALTEESAMARFRSGRMDFSVIELLYYNMRHVQHHSGQFNLVLKQRTGTATRWVGRARGD